MNRVAFFLPLIALVAAFLFGCDTHYWWAYTLITAAAEGLLYLMFFLKNSSVEYLSGYATALIHHFPWVERKERTESRTVNGKTQYMTRVSYVNHGDEYFCELNTGTTIDTDLAVFNRIREKWCTPPQSIQVKHSNCVGGGGGERYEWNGKEYSTEAFTYTHRYRNPVKNSKSVLRGSMIKKDEAQALGLFEYPEIVDKKQQVILVSPDLQYTGDIDQANHELQIFNAFYGADKQIHVFILLFPARDGSEIALKQRYYWKGCNKNELVVCLGVSGNSVEWCETLSWMDEPTLDREAKEYFRYNHTASLSEFVMWLRGHVDLWKRKEVKDFKHTSLLTAGNMVYLWCVAISTAGLVFLLAYLIGG